MKKWTSLILAVVIFITSSISFSYAKESREGFIKCYNMNNEEKYECPVIADSDGLYMDANYISKISGYSIKSNEESITFYKETNVNSNLNNIYISLSENKAYYANNEYSVDNMIDSNNNIYLPLEKILYLMHSQWIVKKGVLGVETPEYSLYDFIETENNAILSNMVKDSDILIAGEDNLMRSIRATLSTVVDDFSPTLFIPFYGGQKFEQDQYEKVLLELCKDDAEFLDNSSKKNIASLLENSNIEQMSKLNDSLGRFLELIDNTENADNIKDAFKSINIFDSRCIDKDDYSIPIGDIVGGGLTIWKTVSEAKELENRSKQWTRDYMNQIEVIANSDLSIYDNKSYMKNAKRVANKLINEKNGKYSKAVEKALNAIVEQDLNALASLTIAGKLVTVVSMGTDIVKILNPNAEEGLNRGKLSALLKSTVNISAIGFSEMRRAYLNIGANSNKDDQQIKKLRSSTVLLLRSNLRAKEYIYYLKSDDKWDYKGEKQDLKKKIEKDYALLCELSETAKYDKALAVNSDFKSMYSKENGKYRVNILESDINIFEKNDITMEQFKNSCLAGCTDNCRIEDVFSCPYVGDSENAKYTKLLSDEFEIKYNDLAFRFRCDGKKAYLIKYINRSNPKDSQIYTDKDSLSELYGQLHDWYNAWKNENIESKNQNTNNDTTNNNKNESTNDDSKDENTITKEDALELAKAEGGTYDKELGTNIIYKYEGICYHEDCFCTYKDKPSYLFTIKLENTKRVIGYICVYNDGSLVRWYDPRENW